MVASPKSRNGISISSYPQKFTENQKGKTMGRDKAKPKREKKKPKKDRPKKVKEPKKKKRKKEKRKGK